MIESEYSPLYSPFQFHRQVMDCVVGGVSALDIRRLSLASVEEARQFIGAYGYNLEDPESRDQLWASHRRAVAMIKEQLLEEGETIPEALYEPGQLKDLTQLLMYASSRAPGERELQRWACAILRVMHVYVHLSQDLFSAFRDEIQAQILKPIHESIVLDDVSHGAILGPHRSVSGNINTNPQTGLSFTGTGANAGVGHERLAPLDQGIHLHKFEIKPFKTTASSVIKLLARPERVALTLLDKLGVRFVTRDAYDSFRVIRFLVENHVLSFPHIIPDQSSNTLFPMNIFLEVMDELRQAQTVLEDVSADTIQQMLNKRLHDAKSRAEYLEKPNKFSDPDYRMIKFISRKLITVSVGPDGQQRAFKFFYPYEIQIMDFETYQKNLSGPMAHDEYKKRQRRKARERVMGPND